MAVNYDINYNDKRFTEVESDKQEALSDIEKNYGGMIAESDKYYQAQIDASKEWADTQTKLQQEQTDFAIEKIEQEKAQAQKDYTKEQSGAYVDWQKQSNQYGANAEQMAAAGLAGSGYSESSMVSMYNTYQNRVTAARDAYQKAVLNYNNSIQEAKMKNNSLLAEIAYESLQQQLSLSLQGFQYKNTLLLEKANQKRQVDQDYHNRYLAVLDQINTENALKEQVRQADLANAREQERIKLAQAAQKLEEDKFKYQKSQDAKKTYTPSKPKGTTPKGKTVKTKRDNYVQKVTKDEEQKHKTSATAYLNKLIASGASKDKVSNEIAIALRNGEITKAEAQKLRKTFTPRGLAY